MRRKNPLSLQPQFSGELTGVYVLEMKHEKKLAILRYNKYSVVPPVSQVSEVTGLRRIARVSADFSQKAVRSLID